MTCYKLFPNEVVTIADQKVFALLLWRLAVANKINTHTTLLATIAALRSKLFFETVKQPTPIPYSKSLPHLTSFFTTHYAHWDMMLRSILQSDKAAVSVAINELICLLLNSHYEILEYQINKLLSRY